MDSFGHSGGGSAALILSAVTLIAAVAMMSVHAHGQVLNNRDDVARSVTIQAKSMRRRFDVEPGAAIRDFCGDGCVIRIDEDEGRDFLIEGNERLSIEGGLVYFDGEIVEKPEGDEAASARERDDDAKTGK